MQTPLSFCFFAPNQKRAIQIINPFAGIFLPLQAVFFQTCLGVMIPLSHVSRVQTACSGIAFFLRAKPVWKQWLLPCVFTRLFLKARFLPRDKSHSMGKSVYEL